jgi:hypothetical protein
MEVNWQIEIFSFRSPFGNTPCSAAIEVLAGDFV